MSLIEYAEEEIKAAGLNDPDPDSDYNGDIGKAVLELIQVFSNQGHSGMSASIVRNVFNKLDKPDYSSIMNKIQPLNTTRDRIVTDVQNEYKLQTNVMSVNKLLSDFIEYFKRMFNLGSDTAKKAKDNIGHLEDEIRNTQMQLDQIKQTQPFIQILLVSVLAVALLYMFGSILGSLIHWIAILILVGGLLFATNFSQASK
jgi:hypothetical protein